MFKKIKSLLHRDLWTLYLYYNGVCIKHKKIRDIDDITVMSINVLGHRELFGKNKVNIVIRPVKLLFTDEKNKKTYWGVVFEKGVDI